MDYGTFLIMFVVSQEWTCVRSRCNCTGRLFIQVYRNVLLLRFLIGSCSVSPIFFCNVSAWWSGFPATGDSKHRETWTYPIFRIPHKLLQSMQCRGSSLSSCIRAKGSRSAGVPPSCPWLLSEWHGSWIFEFVVLLVYLTYTLLLLIFL